MAQQNPASFCQDNPGLLVVNGHFSTLSRFLSMSAAEAYLLLMQHWLSGFEPGLAVIGDWPDSISYLSHRPPCHYVMRSSSGPLWNALKGKEARIWHLELAVCRVVLAVPQTGCAPAACPCPWLANETNSAYLRGWRALPENRK